MQVDVSFSLTHTLDADVEEIISEAPSCCFHAMCDLMLQARDGDYENVPDTRVWGGRKLPDGEKDAKDAWKIRRLGGVKRKKTIWETDAINFILKAVVDLGKEHAFMEAMFRSVLCPPTTMLKQHREHSWQEPKKGSYRLSV